MSYSVGYDIFKPTAGQKENMQCKACGAEMNVDRNIEGYRGNVQHPESIRQKEKVDVFTCPHSAEGWHTQLIALLGEQKKTSSYQLSELLGAEIETIRQTKMATLERYQ